MKLLGSSDRMHSIVYTETLGSYKMCIDKLKIKKTSYKIKR